MEYINKVELQGYISSPTISYMKDKRVARFSLATQYIFKGVEGSLLTETTWFDCVAFENDNIDFSIIQTGNTLNVVGRLREKDMLPPKELKEGSLKLSVKPLN